jgi:ribonuclease BN (tRNA processing enzyme)
VRVHEFEAPAVVHQTDRLRISAAKVMHPPLPHAYAYRFDAHDRSIVLSGDTCYWPDLIDFARGADVLLHEVMHLGGIDRLVARMPQVARLREHLLAAHTKTRGRQDRDGRRRQTLCSIISCRGGDDPT